jgi:hypothetical protein
MTDNVRYCLMHASNFLPNSWASIDEPMATIWVRGVRSPHGRLERFATEDLQR